MSILNRLNLLIRSNLNDAINSRGEASLGSAFQEMESSLRDARRRQVELRQGEKRLVQQIRDARERADRWEERAMLALRSGDEDLAREALVVKNKAVREANHLRDQLDEHRGYMRDISSALEALEMKLEGTRGRMRALAQEERRGGGARPASDRQTFRTESNWDAELERRRRREQGGQAPTTGPAPSRPSAPSASSARPTASTRQTPTEYDKVFQTDTYGREFDRMTNRIDSMEAEIDAIRELSGEDDLIDPRRAELEGIFRKMETRKVVGDDLADLKKRFED